MAKFAIYNYQFEKIIESTTNGQKIDFTDGVYKDPDVAFEHRQEIFGQLFPETATKELPFQFWNGAKYHIHRLILPPSHGLVAFRLSNKKRGHRTNEDLQKIEFDDFPCITIIIDNRPGIQRILIEQNQSVFKNIKTVARILQKVFNKQLMPNMLKIELYAQYPENAFWDVVKQHKEGFRKVTFHLPYLNLKRLSDTVDGYLTDARKAFDSALDFSFSAEKGMRLELDEKNKLQSALTKAVSLTGQPTSKDKPSIVLVTTGQNPSYIKIGKDAYVTTVIPEPTLKALTSDQLTIEGDSHWDALEHKLDTLNNSK